MTLRPLGPSVTLTARASLAMPRRMASRASWSNAICLAAILPPVWDAKGRCLRCPERDKRGRLSHGRGTSEAACPTRSVVQHGQDVLLAHEQDVVLPVVRAELVS